MKVSMDKHSEALDERPWEQTGVLRRDCEPHRGTLLLALGGVSILIGLIALFVVLPAFPGMFIAVAICAIARNDLTEMRAGTRDSSGKEDTEHSLGLAVAGMVMNCIALFMGSLFLLRIIPF
jgi:hypothetical protein